jgi:thiol:disulfide interchange protein DsbC
MAGSRPMGGKQDCDTSGLLAILKAGEKYKIQNTPTVFLANGKRLVGATPPEVFMSELEAASSPQ